jgi:hypothetical protein
LNKDLRKTDLLPKELIYSAKADYFTPDNWWFPTNEPVIELNEEITDYPGTVDLLNAVKISGRTEKGLGIGFLNAVTKKLKLLF